MVTNTSEYQKEYQREYRKTHPQKQYRKQNNPLNELHLRIKKLKTKQKYCSICNQTKKLVLSNTDGNYSEDPKDYWWLCYECHKLYDKTNKTHRKKVKNKMPEVKLEVKKEMFEISLERLRPPREVETSVEVVSLPLDIDHDASGATDSKASEMDPVKWLASNHSFHMLINEMLSKFAPGFREFGIKTRGKKEVIRNSFNNARQELIKELKEVLKKRQKIL